MSAASGLTALRFVLALGVVHGAGAASAAVPGGTPPTAGSPGSADRALAVRDGCPTFSWSEAEGREYEIAAYRLLDGGTASDAPSLHARIEGAFFSWTPSLEQCLPPGRYAWVVRANTAAGWTEWSEPRLFEVRAQAPAHPQPMAPESAHPVGLHRSSPAIVESQTPAGGRLFTSAAQGQRSLTGAAFSPPTCNGTIFSDVTGANPNCAWIEQLAADEIAQPCEDNGIFGQRFCPDHPVTRGQIAGLLERAMRGTDTWRAEQGDGAVPNLPPGLPGITPLVTGGDTGQHTSITVGADGLGLIAYRDAGDLFAILRVAHCSNIACTAASSTPIGLVPAYTSITIGADGFGLISYYDALNQDLRVAHCANVECTTGDANTELDTEGDVGLYTSITIGADGLGLISYYDATNGDLKVAHCANVQCSVADAITPVDTADDVGRHTSITTGIDGRGLISYFDATHFLLKVAHCTDLLCTGAPSTPLEGATPGTTSITIGTDGLGLISYFRVASFVEIALRVAHCSDINCSSATLAFLDPLVAIGAQTSFHSSITIGADGLALIGYNDSINGDLKVAHCWNANCTAISKVSVDTGGLVGRYTSITIGADGLGLISYYDETNGDLKVAHCSNVLCAPYFRRR